MPPIQNIPGSLSPRVLSPGQPANQPAGDLGDSFVSEIHGKYYTQARNGNLFIGSTASAGVVLPAFSATAAVFVLWNPAGSGVNLVPVRLKIGWVSGPGAPGNFAWGFATNLGSQVATGAPITAATLVAAVNAKLGLGNKSVANFAPGTLTFASGPAFLETVGLSQLTTTAATTSAPFFTGYEDYDGSLIVPPGSAISLGGNVATTTTADVTLKWYETPAA